MVDRILDARHRPVMEERRLQRSVAQRRAAELIAIVRVQGNLLQTKVFVLTRAIEHYVARAEAEFRRDLWHGDYEHLEVAKPLIRVTYDRMALTAPALAEE